MSGFVVVGLVSSVLCYVICWGKRL